MEILSINESLPLIQAIHKGVLTVGLWESLSAFGEADSNPQNRCARSIFRNYSDGSDFQDSISKAVPQLPRSIIQILIAGYQNSVLDLALGDMEETISRMDVHDSAENGLLELMDKYGRCSTSEICQGCFEREMEQMMNRARADEANIVELEQIGESFLELRFRGKRQVRVKRPTHSLVYSTILQKLSNAAGNDGVMQIGAVQYKIKKKNLASYLISIDNQEVLQVVFRGITNRRNT